MISFLRKKSCLKKETEWESKSKSAWLRAMPARRDARERARAGPRELRAGARAHVETLPVRCMREQVDREMDGWIERFMDREIDR